jgi:hypothetical protein
MRVHLPIMLCLFVAGCASAPEPQPQKVAAVNCRSTEPRTGSNIVHKDDCPLAMTEEERQQRIDELERDRMRSGLIRPGGSMGR